MGPLRLFLQQDTRQYGYYYRPNTVFLPYYYAGVLNEVIRVDTAGNL
jgi:hypothetical protein